MLVTAYNIASEYSSDGECQFTLGSLISVNPFFSLSQPARVNSTAFLSTVFDSFSAYLGFSTCSGTGEEISASELVKLPVATVITTLTPVTTVPNRNTTQAVVKHSSGSYNKKVKIANGVAIPVAFLGLSLLGFLVYRRRRIMKTQKEEDATSQRQGSPHEGTQPYLQQKGELEADENRKHELEARERRYEIGSGGERYELPVERENTMIRTRQELRGEEHSTELEVPR